MDRMTTEARQMENSLLTAFDRAAGILRKAEPGKICRKTGARFEGNRYSLPFLERECVILMPEVRFTVPELPVILQVLILHYLTGSGERPVRGEFIGFSDIPEGMFYYRSFRKKAVDKLAALFGQKPELLEQAGTLLGGRKWTAGDYSSRIPVLPEIDMVVQIYRGDEEFPAAANILFSDCIVNFLPPEDTAFLGGWLVRTLAQALPEDQSPRN